MRRQVVQDVPSRLGMLGVLVALAGCGGASGNIQYFRVAAQQATFVQAGAKNCAGSETNNVAVISYTGIDGLGTWAIYTAPAVGGQAAYLLDDGSGNLLEGTLSSGIYTFSGVYTHEVKPQTTGPDVTSVTKETVTLTLSGDGFTGTVAVELVCSEIGGSHECGPPVGAQAGSGYDCTTQYAITGTTISATEAEAIANPTVTPPQPGGGAPSQGGPTGPTGSMGSTGSTGPSGATGSSGCVATCSPNDVSNCQMLTCPCPGGGTVQTTNCDDATGCCAMSCPPRAVLQSLCETDGGTGNGSGLSGSWTGTLDLGNTFSSDTEIVTQSGSTVTFTDFDSSQFSGCTLTFSVTSSTGGNVYAILSGSTSCTDQSGNSWTFSSGNVGGTSVSMSLNLSGTDGSGTAFTASGSYTRGA